MLILFGDACSLDVQSCKDTMPVVVTHLKRQCSQLALVSLEIGGITALPLPVKHIESEITVAFLLIFTSFLTHDTLHNPGEVPFPI